MKDIVGASIPLTIEEVAGKHPAVAALFPEGIPAQLPNPGLHVGGEPEFAAPFFDANAAQVPKTPVQDVFKFCDAITWLSGAEHQEWLPIWMAATLVSEMGLITDVPENDARLHTYCALERVLLSGERFLNPELIEEFLRLTSFDAEIDCELAEAFNTYKKHLSEQ